MKFLLPEMQPATAQITNPTWQNTSFFFFFDSFLDADSMIQDLFTAPVLWNRLGLHEMPLHDPNNPFLTKHERILLFFFVLLLLHCLAFCHFFFTSRFCLLFFVMPELLPNRNKTTWGSGVQRWHCTAVNDAHETVRWN